MMRWHFSPDTGSRFWLSRRDHLGFDPVAEVVDVASLALFGSFDKADLRRARVADLLPRGFAGRPFRVVETGGSTGPPCRVPDVTRQGYDVHCYRVMLEARGLARGDVLATTPSGPHAYGHFVAALAASWGGAAFAVDFDPRWVKQLQRSGRDSRDYVRHLVWQTIDVLAAEHPALLFTTSKLLLALAVELGDGLAAHGVRAVCTGGTSCTPEEARFLREEVLEEVAWIDTYGNTLVGHALQADPVEPGTPVSYHLPPPLALLRVVDPADPQREVSLGERGRVQTTTLLKELFLPNLLERYNAIRVGPHPWFPWDGVAQVRPDPAEQENGDGTHEIATEGVY
jgi:acyl-coenzyme A synthetase/AMP-(fatty) acid ligase